jgi:hypothetical protein
MSKSNTANDGRSKESDSDDWIDLGGADHDESDSPAKVDRINRKRNAEARRRYEMIREDMQLKALIDGDRWF